MSHYCGNVESQNTEGESILSLLTNQEIKISFDHTNPVLIQHWSSSTE